MKLKVIAEKLLKILEIVYYFTFQKLLILMDMEAFRETIECGFKILDARYIVNEELLTTSTSIQL